MGREFTDIDPRTLYPNALDSFIKEMEENGWDRGQDDEELFELAMHPEQYRNYKSGQAKKNFDADLQKAIDAKLQANNKGLSKEQLEEYKHAESDAIVAPVAGQIVYEFGGGDEATHTMEPAIGTEYKEGETLCYLQTSYHTFDPVPAALGGRITQVMKKRGDRVNKGDVIAYIKRKN